MILTIDIGNTNITFGVFDGDKLSFVSRLATERNKMCIRDRDICPDIELHASTQMSVGTLDGIRTCLLYTSAVSLWELP